MTTTTLDWNAIRVGDAITPMVIDVTATVVVAGAIATRDFMPVHHDRDYANSQGAPEHLHEHPLRHRLLQPVPHRLGRARTRWCKKLAIRLGVPAFPGSHARRTPATVTGTSQRRRRGHRRGRVPRDERPRRARRRHRRDRPPARERGVVTPVAARPRRDRRHRPDRVLEGVGPQRAPARVRGGARPRSTTPASPPPTSTGSSRSRWTQRGDRGRAQPRHPRADDVHPHPLRRRRARARVVMQAAMAVATGVADVVVCYRAFNERSGMRFGDIGRGGRRRCRRGSSWYAPYGLLTPAAWVALHARRYMHDVRRDQRGLRPHRGGRPHARGDQPDAWFYERPITLEDHQASRWIVEPVLRLLDCCQESDGGVALVVTTPERARDLRQPPARDRRRGPGRGRRRRDDDELLPRRPHRPARDGRGRRRSCGPMSGLAPADISDRVPLRPLHAVRARCSSRSSASAAAARRRTSRRSSACRSAASCPINTSGGLLGEAYIHGMNGITEAVRQIRGTSCNQVDDVEHVLVTAGTGVPTSGLILGRD